MEGDGPKAIREAAAKVFGAKAAVHPMMNAGATDSRYLRQMGVLAYGIHTAPGTLDDARKGFGAHGANERRAVAWLDPGTRFLEETVRALLR